MAPKAKPQKMALGTFLQDETLGSWADEMEDMPLPSTESRSGYGGERRAFSSAGGFGSGMNDRGAFAARDRETLPLPTQPPYTAHIGNMSFDASQQDVEGFFHDCQVTNVRIVEDKLDRKPKGFGYVEFGSLDGLKKALSYSGSNLGGRMIRVSVAEPPKDRQDGRDFSDWSRKGPLPDLPGGQRRVSERPAFASGGGRNFDNTSDAGSERGGSRRGYEQGDGKVRDFGDWSRKGPLSPAAAPAPAFREGGRPTSNDGPQFRKSSPAWGEGRSQDGSRPPRRDYQDRPPVERTPTAAETDSQWRSKMRPDPPAKSPTPSRDTSNPPSPAAAAPPTSRPRLNLTKRTVSEAEPGASPVSSATDSKASPFGAARPIDTATREKEIEEKRQLTIRQKREADEKARTEKAEEKRLAKETAVKEKGNAEKSSSSVEQESQNGQKEGGSETTQPGKNFEILRRASGVDMEADDEENGEETDVVEDKAVKPKEVVRDAPAKANGGWRKAGEPKGTAPAEETATTMEDDGWSTIPAKPRKQGRGNAGARALAS